MTLAELVADHLGPYCTSVIDVGARRWALEDRWYLVPPLAKLIGFEPDEKECAELNASCPPQFHYVSLGLHKYAGEATLYQTSSPACSSFYEPDQELAKRYPGLECIRRTESVTVPVVPLDQWAEAQGVTNISFLKIDTQGSELDILEGSRHVVKNCVGVQVEVEFSPIYHNQPLFADVDAWLRKQGFHLWQLTELTSYTEKRKRIGRLFWANGIYFRDFKQPLETYQHLLLAAFFDALGDTDSAFGCCEMAGWPKTMLEYFQNIVED